MKPENVKLFGASVKLKYIHFEENIKIHASFISC